jgi:hypothetical protein
MADPETDIRTLDVAYPIALFPVRIETRFAAATSELLIRVYPDEIVARLRDPLSPEERDAGVAFWQEAWNPVNELDAWRRLATGRRSQRAADIVRTMTPDNIEDRPSGSPTWGTPPPAPPPLPGAYTDILPDCWVAIAYRDDDDLENKIEVVGNDIVQPLALSFTRDLPADSPTLVNYNGLTIEPDLLWLLDFDEAVDVGMGIRMPITSTDLTEGFDRLIVLGVKAALQPGVAATQLQEVLDGHHYAQGLAIVPQGTPTNNSSEGTSGYPAPEDPDRSYGIELGTSLLAEDSDGDLIERAFGIVPGTSGAPRVFDHVEGANRIEQQRTGLMSEALWPCTLGYFLEQLASPLINPNDIPIIREHYIKNVRGRGPLPAIRVGRVPYGLLPVMSLRTQQEPSNPHLIEGKLRNLIGVWNEECLALTGNVARVGATSDPDEDLLGVLALDASSREVRLRELVGPAYARSVMRLFGIQLGTVATIEAARAALAAAMLEAAGIDGTPRIAGMTFAEDALRVGRRFVTTDPLSEVLPLPAASNYITAIREASSIDAIRNMGAESTAPLLLHLLRQAALVEYNRLAVKASGAIAEDGREVELFRIDPRAASVNRKTPWERFDEVFSGSQTLGAWLLDDLGTATDQETAKQWRSVLSRLETIPTAELERLFTETLDTCSHRLDAWIISLATRQLNAMRDVNAEGIHIGGFGFVENLRPQSAGPGTPGGYIHAPSASHAAAAAILRNGYLSRPASHRADLAVDLSSERVRRALRVLDGVRQGQPVGAVLGYAFERGLHEKGMDKYIAPFRRMYPLGRDPAGQEEGSTERIAARDVVNGLALRDALVGFDPPPWGNQSLLPIVPEADWDEVEACIDALESDVDSVADLLMAESVYQIVQGNTDRTSANLATLAGNGSVPAPSVISVPRAGTNFTHRVAIALGSSSSSPWNVVSPRRSAEPRLEAWIGTLLGPPSNIVCRIHHPALGDPETIVEESVTAADLDLSAMDFYAIAQRVPTSGGGELEARVQWHSRALPQPVQVRLERPLGSTTSVLMFDEAVEVARLVAEFVGGARPLGAEDLLVPGRPEEITAIDELQGRADAVDASFATAHAALNSAIEDAESPTPPPTFDDLREALWGTTLFGLHEAVPLSLSGEEPEVRAALLAQALSVQAEMERRRDAFEALPAPANPGLDRLRALLGPDLAILPTFNPANREDVNDAIDLSPVNDEFAARLWFDRVARVRSPLGRLRIAALATQATAGAELPLDVAQLPHVEDAPWIGGEIPRASDSGPRPQPGTLSLVMHRQGASSLEAGTWAGLVVDEWVENVPNDKQMTTIALHHDSPGAEAPQCVVLAVPAPNANTWELETLVDVVHQTLDLAKIRAVDSDHLGMFSLLAPCIYLAANVADHAVTSRLDVARIGETEFAPPE